MCISVVEPVCRMVISRFVEWINTRELANYCGQTLIESHHIDANNIVWLDIIITLVCLYYTSYTGLIPATIYFVMYILL